MSVWKRNAVVVAIIVVVVGFLGFRWRQERAQRRVDTEE